MQGLFVFVLFVASVYGGDAYGPGFSLTDVKSFTMVSSVNSSSLYTANLVSGAAYDYPVYLIDLHGSRYDLGYAYGYLLADQIQENFDAMKNSILPSSWSNWEKDLAWSLAAVLFDWQWNDWLSVQVPQQYMQEFQGAQDGGVAAGKREVGSLLTQLVVIANLPSDMVDMKYVFENELKDKVMEIYAKNPSVSESLRAIESLRTDKQYLQQLWELFWKRLKESRRLRMQNGTPSGMQCSMFSVWGSRTINNELYSARNLDYVANLGINKNKVVCVYHPNDGAYAHVTYGFAGVFGAFAGQSQKGITVHEANLEEDIETFLGFPWIIRLRWIMENAENLSQAQALWEQSNNTVGYNHMVGSAVDAAPGSHAAMAFETNGNYTAYFYDDDPREANATLQTYAGPVVRIGFPLKEALWRTNNGFDPVIREHYMWRNFSAGKWSEERYLFAFENFVRYEKLDTKIGFLQAVNITSILGDKGHSAHLAYHCSNTTDGTNILSVTFHPAAQKAYVAWDNGANSTWRPACCNSYVLIDLNRWW